MKRRRSFEALHGTARSGLETLVLRIGGVDSRLVLTCCLGDHRGDGESRQRCAASGLDEWLGSSLRPGCRWCVRGLFLVEDGSRFIHLPIEEN